MQTILLFYAFITLCVLLGFLAFNGWLFLALMLGVSFGYVLFRRRRRFLSADDSAAAGVEGNVMTNAYNLVRSAVVRLAARIHYRLY